MCLYQGEELGQTETELTYDELLDPQGKSFWPDDKGRDGCRTPMVWDDTEHSGFSRVSPWLPIKPPQASRAVSHQESEPDSVLAFYRKMLTLRRAQSDFHEGSITFLETPEPILAFMRGNGTFCAFNLSPETVSLQRRQPDQILLSQSLVSGPMLTLGPNGFVIASISAGV